MQCLDELASEAEVATVPLVNCEACELVIALPGAFGHKSDGADWCERWSQTEKKMDRDVFQADKGCEYGRYSIRYKATHSSISVSRGKPCSFVKTSMR